MISFKKLLIILFGTSLFFSCTSQNESDSASYDVCVYGGTSAGVMAAYTAKMMGKSVLLIEPGKHLGGLSASGLGETDIGNKYTVTGLSRNFYRRLGQHYGQFEAWRFEPHVAEKTFNEYIKEAGVEVLYDHRIIDAETEDNLLQSIQLENTTNTSDMEKRKTILAKLFIDCTYEGDLMAKSGVGYTIGREANSVYNETLNGVQFHGGNQVPDGIDPYIIEGDSSSGLLWGINPDLPAPVGSGDKKIQAYNYRLCLTTDSTNMLPITKPANYDPSKYEILRRIIKQRDEAGWVQRIYQLYLRIMPMPNQKTDINNKGGFSTDLIGGSWEYPEANYERRKEIEQEHRTYIEGLLYFLGNDPEVPQHIKEQMNQYGWPKDEVQDNGHFPHQIYVRESRRLLGEFVMTEHHCRGTEVITDTIAMGAYNMDSHNTDRHVVNGMLKNEGDVQEGVPPYPIAYRSILPKKQECKNLLVPVCISASHIAYGSIRMEPVFMMLGQAAGAAAVLSLNQEIAVQELSGKVLKDTLKLNPLANGTPAEIILNNEDLNTKIEGDWTVSTKPYTGKYNVSYLETTAASGNHNPTKVTFQSAISKGKYAVYFYVTGKGRKDRKTRSKSVPVRIIHGMNTFEQAVDMENNEQKWVLLGEYEFDAGNLKIEVNASAKKQIVIADAVLLLPI